MTYKIKTASIIAAAVIGCSPPAMAQSSAPYKVTLSTGYNYSTGDYGQAVDTTITYVPVVVKVKRDAWTAKLTVPYIKITGPGVVTGGDETSTTGTAGAKGTESGLGDVLASLGYTMPVTADKKTFLDLTGKIKFPTADEDKKLGTGNTDYTLQLGLTHTYRDAYATATVGRKFNGNSARFDLDDVWKYSVGGGYNFTAATSAGVTYDWREAATDTGKDFSQATAYATHKLTRTVALQAYAGTGFSDAAADFSTGLQLSYKFGAFGGSED